MNVLVIGGGGREHALAWRLAQSPRVERVFVAPGNGGTGLGGKICNLQIDLRPTHAAAAIRALGLEIGLVVIGPEGPLAGGIVDALQAAGLRCFGPTQAASRLEASKAFAKEFMARHGIPTARFACFSEHDRALAYLRRADFPVVVKASGLAAGKGVIVPETPAEAEKALRQIMVERAFGAAGDEVIVEERLYGQEASVLAFCDGRTVSPMPAAQDHKRVFDGDQGPNTGGMGAYAPAPAVTSPLTQEITETILRPTMDGLLAEGIPYVGVLYAGLMLTAAGPPKVLEFNCRFGDPETQAILPLLESDLVEILEACVEGTLDRLPGPGWRDGLPAYPGPHGLPAYGERGAAATVVAASAGYPGAYPRDREITGVGDAEALPGVAVFHAGTRLTADGRLLTDGGRVLAVTGAGDSLKQALDRAYAGMALIHFDGMHYRRDIGARCRE